jgi:predicted Fe-Mo cluster-binding NifX family protein
MDSGTKRIAIPVADAVLAPHFGHCKSFELVDIDLDARSIVGRQTIPAPPHEPGLLPRWLAGQGAAVVVAGGMGNRAQELFHQHGMEVVLGVQTASPSEIAERYLAGTLDSGANTCDH